MARLEDTTVRTPGHRARRHVSVPDAFAAEIGVPEALSSHRAQLALQPAPLPCSADEKWLYDRTHLAA